MEMSTQKNRLDAVEICIRQLKTNLHEFTTKFQPAASIHNFYPKSENIDWTTGFCTGEYWLAYELTRDEAFRRAAEVQVESFLQRIEKKIDVNHHDMGFLYVPSCVAAYKLTGSEIGRKAALLAADQLLNRFQEKGQFIQAWGDPGAPDEHRLIIDSLLNMPLLFWASDVTGEPKYRAIAEIHCKSCLKNLLRPDNSTYHTYFFDPETGEPLYGVTRQGYRDDSAWARGQAWGVYGTVLAYRHTRDEQCIALFEKITGYFLAHLPADGVPYWDLCFTAADGEPRDSSAAAIAVCGMLEMAQYLPEEKAAYYRKQAQHILDSLICGYAAKSPEESNGLLLHGVYAKNSPYNPIPKDVGVDECCTWGDYFYLEALTREAVKWAPYW